ncbi:sensor histidine kinase [Burkholderia cenocepacia]|uniref:sensor histidine kinase n=2 Tax=Burkholderia cenocepacia TaxID=95486 RepID=UPI0019032098|nr:ATP-binding protein [Burkholderia cenocepacia]MBJ9895203.1 two-component sensor histidine kinase [Burkholderia cenocepacia]MBJ9915408.1 two-component sensor histidine kinase [Burkholderia cenocepacia]MBR8101137.1 two-component sensor histidine kinase [Burkholderia cenocepacia]MBR8118526.1 two-component sensor histidine kinase [Burkholderia cenocepacia]MBR8139877.1 two-component sensor histidine kinase [Burkholderia cenocepacia]
MDGFKERLKTSIQFKLSFTLSVVILAVAALAGAFSFVSALDEAHELQDDVLRQVAHLMDRRALSPTQSVMDGLGKDGDEESRVIVQRLGDGIGSSVGVDAGGPLQLPPTLADGMHTMDVAGESFRILVRTTVSGTRIAVAQESAFRDEIARDGALRTVMPFLVLVPLLLVIVADLVRKMFLPVALLATKIDQRDERELHSIEVPDIPVEVRPFVVAMNRLLGRVAQSVDTQRRFVADAAHELRSPLTALSLQAERLAEVEMSVTARDRLTVLRRGIERGRRLLDQLLALARAQSSDNGAAVSSVSVQHVFRNVLEDMLPLAETKNIDIGVEGNHDCYVWATELDMTALVKNLVDNAVRYTPEGGRIDLSVGEHNKRAVIRIRDTGPGIPLAERDRVFDPFYRALGSGQAGSGLGLSIVRTIACKVGAELGLEFSDPSRQCGLIVTVLMPISDRASDNHARSP